MLTILRNFQPDILDVVSGSRPTSYDLKLIRWIKSSENERLKSSDHQALKWSQWIHNENVMLQTRITEHYEIARYHIKHEAFGRAVDRRSVVRIPVKATWLFCVSYIFDEACRTVAASVSCFGGNAWMSQRLNNWLLISNVPNFSIILQAVFFMQHCSSRIFYMT
jgi:SPX domain protein involved in polyphosphate accumulation